MAVRRIDPRVELFHDDQWNDIGNRVRGGKSSGFGIDISRGRPDETATVDPSSCNLQINNQDGRFTPLNPRSPLFGKIGQNTPLRTYLGTKHAGDTNASSVPTTQAVAPSVTATKSGLLISSWAGAVDEDTYTIPASMTLGQDTAENNARFVSAFESVPAGPTGTRTATVSDDRPFVATSTVLHGDSVTAAEVLGGAARSATDPDITLATSDSTEVGQWLVAVHSWFYFPEAQQRFFPSAPQDFENGWILLADSGPFQTSDFGVSHTKVWTRRVNVSGSQQVTFFGFNTLNMTNNAHLYVLSGVDPWNIRFSGEVSEWPLHWDQFGNNVWVPIEANGPLRRLGQGAKPLRSAMTRAISGELISNLQVSPGRPLGPLAYWPLEDGKESTFGAAAIGDDPLQMNSFDGGELEWAEVEAPAGSEPLPDFRQFVGTLTASVSGADPDRGYMFSFITAFDTAGVWQVFEVRLFDGPFFAVRLRLSSTELRLLGIDSEGNATLIGDIPATIDDGVWRWIQVLSFAAGGNISFRGEVFDEDGNEVIASSFGSVAGTSPGAVTRVVIRSLDLGELGGLGHAAVWPSTDPGPPELAREAMNGYLNERAGRRIERLCSEEMVAFHPVGNLDETQPMGPQTVKTFLSLLREAEEAEVGILFEVRQQVGLGFRTRRSMFNQQATLAADYEGCHLGHPLEPTLDDQQLVNDVTASRVGGSGTGSSAQVIDQDGPRGVDEAGRYDIAVDVNVASDLQLADYAAWLVHLGTVNEYRFPVVRLKNLNPPHCPLDPDVSEQGMALDIGDRLTIDNPPVWVGPDQIQALVQGYREHLDWYEHDLRLRMSPASPFTIGVRLEDDPDPGPGDPVRRDTAGSELAGGLLTTGASGDFASTPDNAALDLTDDIDIRVDATAEDWTPGTAHYLAAKFVTTGNQRAYRLLLQPTTGNISLGWSPDGAVDILRTSTVPPPIPESGRVTIRAFLNADNGSGQHTVTFYTGPSIDGPFTQFGSTVTNAGITSIFNSTAPLEVGSVNGGTLPWFGQIHGMQLRSSFDGTEVANPDFEAQPPGTVSFTDDAGRVWTVNGSARILSGDFVAGTDTSFDVRTTLGPLWGLTGALNMHFPLDVNIFGARVRITGIAAAVGQVQTFTCEQTIVNDVNKTIPAGEPVRLWQPAVRGL